MDDSSTGWKIRALQLDLGRQMETVQTVCDIIDFATRFGYNTLHLYLEGRIRTESFPWPNVHFSYNPSDIQRIVAYANSRNMDVIPQVNCFGHAEQFLRHAELAELNELRGGARGRFGRTDASVFCPSQEDTYEFLSNYLQEVAALFPSTYFHVGCDEVWQIGYCPLCRKRLAEGASQASIFADHINRLHDIVSDRLGKRMMMWDDMFDEYHEALDHVPRDIVQCVWQYDDVVDCTRTHFGRRRRDHRLAAYNRRGIEFLICPALYNARNTATFTQYAKPFRPLGGIMTVWELSERFLYERYPTIAFAGRRWHDLTADDGTLFQNVVSDLFDVRGRPFVEALWLQQTSAYDRRPGSSQSMMRGPLTAAEWERMRATQTVDAVVSTFQSDIKGEPGISAIEDIRTRCRVGVLTSMERTLVTDASKYWTGQPSPALSTLQERGRELLAGVREVKTKRAEHWDRWRPGLRHENGKPIFADWETDVGDLVQRLETDTAEKAVLRVHYALPDQYGAQNVLWKIGSADVEWTALRQDVPKPRRGIHDETPFFTVEYPIPQEATDLSRLCLETWGYGGIGVAFVEVFAPGQWLTPESVHPGEGHITNPESVLKPNTFWATLGNEDTESAFQNAAIAETRHSLEIRLVKQPYPSPSTGI